MRSFGLVTLTYGGPARYATGFVGADASERAPAPMRSFGLVVAWFSGRAQAASVFLSV